MPLRYVMTRQVEDIRPEAPVQEAALKMRSMDVGSLPVCDHGRLVGMITDRDIAVRAVAEGQDPKSTPVRDAMSSHLVCCYEDEDVEAAVKLMEEKQIRRLPVLDRSQRLCGIVSLGDLATRQEDEHLSAEALERISLPKQLHA